MVLRLKLQVRNAEDIENRYEKNVLLRAIRDAISKYERQFPKLQVCVGEVYYATLQVLDNLKEEQENYAIHNLWQEIQNTYFRHCPNAPEQETELAANVICSVLFAVLQCTHIEFYRNETARKVYDQIKISAFIGGVKDFEQILALMEIHEDNLRKWFADYMDGEEFWSDEIRTMLTDEVVHEPITSKMSIEELRISRLQSVYRALKTEHQTFTGKSLWFYIYKLMEERNWYSERSFAQFIRDLKASGVPEEEMIDPQMLSRKYKNDLKENTVFPDWLMKRVGGRADILVQGKMIARTASPYLEDRS